MIVDTTTPKTKKICTMIILSLRLETPPASASTPLVLLLMRTAADAALQLQWNLDVSNIDVSNIDISNRDTTDLVLKAIQSNKAFPHTLYQFHQSIIPIK